MDQGKLKSIQRVLQQEVDGGHLAGANAVVVHQGKEQFYCQVGHGDVSEKKPIRRDSLFRLYSMTKPITGAAAMLLMERGDIDLLEPVSTFLPGFKNQKVYGEDGMVPVRRPVNIKDLLGMTSGLSYGNPNRGKDGERTVAAVIAELGEKMNSNTPLSTVEIANQLGECVLEFQPGERWMYGTSADVLGAVIEVVSGKSYGQFLQDEFFDPLSMKDTGFYLTPEQATRLAKVYSSSKGKLKEFDVDHLGISNRLQVPPAFESGGAGLATTIDDYLKFATMLQNGGIFDGTRILSPETVTFFTSPQLTAEQQRGMEFHYNLAGYNYGNQMRIMTDPGQSALNVRQGEYGWDGWLGCFFSNDPVQKTTVLFMTQLVDAGMLPVARKIRNIATSAIE